MERTRTKPYTPPRTKFDPTPRARPQDAYDTDAHLKMIRRQRVDEAVERSWPEHRRRTIELLNPTRTRAR